MQQKYRWLLQLASIIVSNLLVSPFALAQIASDGSLSTSVEQSGDNFTINDGDRVGNNLFHSFGEFSVPNNGSAAFNNASDVANIFSRVTGGDVSQIDGLIQANGSANLFLINPAGIIFGEGSRLDIGGSFYGGTAEGILFSDGVEFNANEATPLLTINAPVGFNLREDAGNIVNRSVAESEPDEFGFVDPIGLAVDEGESITIEANQIQFDLGLLTAPGGSIELRALNDIAISGNAIDPAFNTSSSSGAGAIAINSSAGSISLVDTDLSSSSFGEGNGGQISVFAQQALILEDTTLTSSADFAGEGGNVSLESATSIVLIDTRIDTGAFDDRRSGDIQITALNNGKIDFVGREDLPAEILADAFGNGEGLEGNQTGGDLTVIGGDITVDNYRLVSIVNPADDFLNPNTAGNGGDISITGTNIAIANNSSLETQTFGEGAAGSITVEGERLTLDNAAIEASNRPTSTVAEDSVGGNINLQLERLLSLRNDSSIEARAINNASGGNINIDSRFIVAFPSTGDGNDVIASAEAGRGGNIDIGTDSIFNLENRLSQPGNSTNDIDASSQLGVDGNVLIDIFSLNQLESIVALSANLVDSEPAVAYSCEAETGTSGLAIRGKGGIPQAPAAPLRSENINVAEATNNSAEVGSRHSNNFAVSVETNNGKIDLAMGAVVRENGTVSLVSSQNLESDRHGGSINCL